MKTFPDLSLFKFLLLLQMCLLVVSCGRQAAHESTPANTHSNDVPNEPFTAPVPPANQTGNGAPATIGDNDEIKLQSLAKAVQAKKANKEVDAADKAMQEFTSHWRPVGKPAKELENLLGKPDERTQEYLGYRFDTGRSGWAWVFQISGGTITNYYRSGIN